MRLSKISSLSLRLRYAAKITQVLDAAPRELLLLLKMQDCLRTLSQALGASHNESVAVAHACLDALARDDLRCVRAGLLGSSSDGAESGPLGSLPFASAAAWRYASAKARLRLYELRGWWTGGK